MLKNSTEAYGLIAIILHWLMALLVIALFALGLWMVQLDYYDAWYHKAPFWHKSFGLFVFLLIVFRLFWRFVNTAPHSLNPSDRIFNLLAKIMHGLLYGLLLLIPFTGYAIATAEGEGVSFFEWFVVPAICAFQNEDDFWSKSHEVLAWILIGLVCAHALAAFWHHFIKKDTTLLRMLGF